MAAYFVGLVDWQTEIGADVDYSGQLLDVVGVGEVSNSAGLEGYSCDALEAGRPDLGGGLVETVFGVDCDHDGLGLGDLAGGDVGQDSSDNYFILSITHMVCFLQASLSLTTKMMPMMRKRKSDTIPPQVCLSSDFSPTFQNCFSGKRLMAEMREGILCCSIDWFIIQVSLNVRSESRSIELL